MEFFTAVLSDIGLDDVRQVGGKGANLGYLMQAGFPVPPGFCVLASAYEMFLAHNDLERSVQEVIDTLDFNDLGSIEDKAAGIRKQMISSPLPDAIEVEFVSAYRELISVAGENHLVAVRSSVGIEDLSLTSFPGQMDTYHNLRGEGEVLQKVKECWASVFSYRAMVGRHTKDLGHFDVFIAPLVQLMIASDSAGVIFTVNPLNNRKDQMVINACFGLGEGVVSGELNCDHFVVDRGSGEILEEEIGKKEYKVVLDSQEGRGSLRVPLSEEERKRSSLSGDQVSELVRVAQEIEEHYSSPQDVEWSFQGGKLYILQSRKVTTLGDIDRVGAAAVEEWMSEFDTTVDPDYPYYTLSNASEVLPGALTPLTISDIVGAMDNGFVKTNAGVGLMKGINPESDYTFVGVFYSRAHINLSVVNAVTVKLPGTSAQEFERMFPEDDKGWEYKKFHPTPRALLALPGPVLRILYKMITIPRDALAGRQVMDERVARARNMDFEKMPYKSYLECTNESREYRDSMIVLHIAASQFAVLLYHLLCKVTERWLGDTGGILASRLVTGLQSLESARPSAEIWDLSRMVKVSPELAEVFKRNEPDAILELLKADRSPGAGEFLKSLYSFLARFGYRSVFEVESMLLNWEDDPSYVFAVIKNYLVAEPGSSPYDLARKQEMDRKSAMGDTLNRLGGARRLLFRLILKQAQKYIALREFMKAVVVRCIAQIKSNYHTLSRRFAAEGIIREPQDLFFLTMEEVEVLASGEGDDIGVEDLVARRRREYERNQTVVLPESSRGRPRPLSPKELELREDIEVLSGIAVSPGRITGRARVITDPRRNAEIKPGEILVAPVTDAAWTPLFVTAGAIVVDVGGPLSHGSIVAREYGIPGVLNVGAATRLVETGQVIIVDGDRGKVYLHPFEHEW